MCFVQLAKDLIYFGPTSFDLQHVNTSLLTDTLSEVVKVLQDIELYDFGIKLAWSVTKCYITKYEGIKTDKHTKKDKHI